MSLPERLKATRKAQNISQAQIANFVGVSQGSIAQIEDGTTKRSVHIPKIAEFLGVTASWLEYGEGEREDCGVKLETDERVLVSNYRRLNKEDKAAMQRVLNALSKQTYAEQPDA